MTADIVFRIAKLDPTPFTSSQLHMVHANKRVLSTKKRDAPRNLIDNT